VAPRSEDADELGLDRLRQALLVPHSSDELHVAVGDEEDADDMGPRLTGTVEDR
jgi:hypothetical protein